MLFFSKGERGGIMALIKCPYCNEEISDKATKCIHCGYEVTPNQEMHLCPECGNSLSPEDKICNRCGCPVEPKKEDSPQKVEVTKIKFSPNRKAIIIAASVILVALGCIFCVISYQRAQERQAAAEALENYKANYEACALLIILQASSAEDVGGLIHDVWSNTIYEKKDDRTDKYTTYDKNHQYFNKDFNDSIANLYLDSDFSGKVDKLQDGKEQVDKLMKDLKNPPEGYKDAYDAIKTLYDAYTSLYNCAANPQGNLSTYTSTFNEADTDVLNAYSNVKLYID